MAKAKNKKAVTRLLRKLKDEVVRLLAIKIGTVAECAFQTKFQDFGQIGTNKF